MVPTSIQLQSSGETLDLDPLYIRPIVEKSTKSLYCAVFKIIEINQILKNEFLLCLQVYSVYELQLFKKKKLTTIAIQIVFMFRVLFKSFERYLQLNFPLI